MVPVKHAEPCVKRHRLDGCPAHIFHAGDAGDVVVGEGRDGRNPESLERGFKSAKTLGASPASLYLLVENADQVVAKAVKQGAEAKGPVMDMFWGDRYGKLEDPFGHQWSVGTHVRDVSPEEMQKAMEQMGS